MSNSTFPVYTPIDLVKDFHALPHYDISFHPVSSDFHPDEKSYQEALIELAIPLSFVALLFVVYFAIRACCCGSREFDPFKPKEARNSRIVVILFLILAAGAMSVSFYGTVHASSAVSEFTDHTSATQDLVNSLLDFSGDISNEAQTVANNASVAPIPTEGKGNQTILVNSLGDMAQQMDSIISSLRGTITVDQWNGQIHDVDKFRNYTTIATSACLVAIMLLAVLAVFCYSVGLLRVCYVLLVIGFFGCWVACSIELSLSVGTADFCMDPNTYVSNEIDVSDATYYILCNAQTQFPFNKEFRLANDAIVAAEGAAAALAGYPGANYTVAVNMVAEEIALLQAMLDCRAGLHDEYQGAVNAACNTGITALVMLLFAHGTAGLLLLIALFAVRNVLRAFSDRHGYIVNTAHADSIATERTGLLSSKATYL